MEAHHHQQRFLAAYDQYADALFRYCYFRVHDRELAKDLLQDCFTKTWRAIVDGEQIDHVRAYLYRVLERTIIDHTRRKREASLDALQEDGVQFGHDTRADLATRIDAKQAIAAIETLDESTRSLVLMRYVDGLPPRMIAKATGLSTNVISVRLHRAMAHLRTILPQL